MQTISEFINECKEVAQQLALEIDDDEFLIHVITEEDNIIYDGAIDEYTINLFIENCYESEYFPNDEDEDKGVEIFWLSIADYNRLTRGKKIENILKRKD